MAAQILAQASAIFCKPSPCPQSK